MSKQPSFKPIDFNQKETLLFEEPILNLDFMLTEDWLKQKNKPIFYYGFGYSVFGCILIAWIPPKKNAKNKPEQKPKVAFLHFEQEKCNTLNVLLKQYEGACFQQHDDLAQQMIDAIFIKRQPFDLFYKGTQLQSEIYSALLRIKTVAYYELIAQQTSKPKAIRATATHIGKNHIAYLIPCHKVLSKTGKIGGFAYDLELKRKLIALDSEKG